MFVVFNRTPEHNSVSYKPHLYETELQQQIEPDADGSRFLLTRRGKAFKLHFWRVSDSLILNKSVKCSQATRACVLQVGSAPWVLALYIYLEHAGLWVTDLGPGADVGPVFFHEQESHS